MKNINTSIGFFKAILTTLITSLAIAGFSCLDNHPWNIIMIVIGMIAYSIVGLFFSIGLINSKGAGKQAYVFVFIILLILGYCVYNGIVAIQNWVVSWPVYVKFLVPSLLLFAIIIIVAVHLFKKSNGCKGKDVIIINSFYNVVDNIK